MRIRIVDCSSENCWYSNQIGSEVRVVEHQKHPNYYVIEDTRGVAILGINREDCVIIEE